MRLVTYRVDERISIGKLIGDQIVDLPTANPAIPGGMRALLSGGEAAMEIVRAVTAEGQRLLSLSAVQLMAPVPDPSKYLAIGMNYAKHVQEAIAAGFKLPETQVWFNKQVTCVNGPYDPVFLPPVSVQLDYEVELCVVIGKRCRRVKAADALAVIAGYTVANDITLRDWQMRSPTMTIGKSFDSHGPIGPWLVTADEIPNPHALLMRLTVNGEVRQEETTAGMINNIFEQIEHLSTAFTLEPGDLIATGTPSGVGIAMKPPRFLQVGDVVRAEIESIGHIETTIASEPV